MVSLYPINSKLTLLLFINLKFPCYNNKTGWLLRISNSIKLQHLWLITKSMVVAPHNSLINRATPTNNNKWINLKCSKCKLIKSFSKIQTIHLNLVKCHSNSRITSHPCSSNSLSTINLKEIKWLLFLKWWCNQLNCNNSSSNSRWTTLHHHNFNSSNFYLHKIMGRVRCKLLGRISPIRILWCSSNSKIWCILNLRCSNSNNNSKWWWPLRWSISNKW